ncbi:MAG: hypothetical protein EXR72_08985 [Myxococcales bacterium]|nr:hypothetical protein [Myxococcales bacterium]
MATRGLVRSAPKELVDERQVDRWVGDLRRIVRRSQIEAAAGVGEYLIEHVYGSVEAAVSHRPAKPASLRRLEERAHEFDMRASGLSRAVPIALQVRVLGDELARSLGTVQHRLLLPVKDATEKRLLAEAATGNQWTAEQLRRQVRRVVKPHAGGRRPEPALVVFLRRSASAMRGGDATQFREEAEGLLPAVAKRLLGSVNHMQATLERLEKLLTRALTRD